MEVVGPVLALLFFAAFFALWVFSIVFWIMAIVEVAKLPEDQFRAAGTDKTMWVIVVVLVGIIGALIWRFVKREDVLAAAGRTPAPPPGWYPEPGGTAMRWWDGVRWTEQRHAPPPG